MLDFTRKLVGMELLPSFRAAYDDRLLSKPHRRVVVTNGCFDVIHAGHVRALVAARGMGEALIVGVNSDRAVRELKGEGRPVNTEDNRALVLAAFEFVDAVCIFNSTRATNFLRIARPDVYVKSADYTLETLNKEERAALEEVGASIAFVPLEHGLSTTSILAALGGAKPSK